MPLTTDDDFAQRWKERSDRWSLVRSVIADWWPPLTKGDGYSDVDLDRAEARLGLPLPVAVREWYEMAGRRADLCATQDYLIRPNELSVEPRDWCTVWAENQGVVLWDVRLAPTRTVDPPAFIKRNKPRAKRQKDARSFSEFALRMLLLQTTITHSNVGSGFVSAAGVHPLIDHYQELGLMLSTWPSATTRFFGGSETILAIGLDPDGTAWTFAAVASEQAAQRLLTIEGIRWDFEPAVRSRARP